MFSSPNVSLAKWEAIVHLSYAQTDLKQTPARQLELCVTRDKNDWFELTYIWPLQLEKGSKTRMQSDSVYKEGGCLLTDSCGTWYRAPYILGCASKHYWKHWTAPVTWRWSETPSSHPGNSNFNYLIVCQVKKCFLFDTIGVFVHKYTYMSY
jgi:hypothetical protein